ncbi:DUF397 domain-containing protein [Streptomyces alfalfae]|uniref:DUF397 domain-containing protein n=1 Tax=Streptomyces alfalfae TaxID=1642299 RepID=A0A1P8TKD8_9ACTN|nr:DUF397 domain-containing protein [Streptomyces alfalfae]AYA18484.1 DUF397 domain-containing protein [Streptomyces fradiae]APY88102.1 hypothetical protein A7J05_22520 [Streptomyces alfalfae]QQC89481.1 DUF397 domain-containing protein [Streptomyces alfalfae]QUI31926.1 DUF397 domain-containing protein [Streptomyces alfalfae]RXX46635.1 DUF397 domain-containing protein [Streptomyces alfalfae]
MSTSPAADGSPAWFKSSYSGGNETECVEVAVTGDDVLIRDSKRPGAALVAVQAETWVGFLETLRHGR